MTTSPWCVMAVRSGWPGSSRPGWWWTRPSPRSSSAAAGPDGCGARVTELGDMSGLVANPGYWRAAAMELLEELPLSVLFGAHGERVVALLEQIQALSRTQAECLAANLDPDAGHAYGRAWLRWSEAQGQQRSTPADDWEGTLAAPGARGKDKSPIHSGFLLVHDQLRRRALALDGDQAIVIETDEDGETEEMLAPLWQDVSDALLYAAMAQGAPQYVDAGDEAALMRAWRACYGQR
ncbi:hypothetical protein WJ968_09535 [Achromobacter xylosoxidans]